MSNTETTPSQLAAAERSAQLERAIQVAPEHFRVLTGDRPTGPLHLGHLFGTLANRVRLQELGVEVLVLVADYQTLTDRDATATLPRDVIDQVADYLAVGIDPDRSTIFAHSQVSALNQLLVPFLSLVSVAEVSRNPTVKEEFAVSGGASMSVLMFTYPVHQAADILFCHANLVPVGRDQLAHLELTRIIARRFNDRYAPDGPYFPEPDGLLGAAPLLLGMDGTKMSKSRGNAIALAASEDDTARLIRGAKTDSERRITYDPEGRPEVSNLLLLGSLCLEVDPEDLAEQVGDAGAAELKRLVTEAVNERLKAIRRRRRELVEDDAYLRHILADGAERASSMADATLTEVRRLMHNYY
jgi:tryptophanyl-tRNA synthetase